MDRVILEKTDERCSSLWQDAWVKLRKNRLALWGLAVLVIL